MTVGEDIHIVPLYCSGHDAFRMAFGEPAENDPLATIGQPLVETAEIDIGVGTVASNRRLGEDGDDDDVVRTATLRRKTSRRSQPLERQPYMLGKDDGIDRPA